MKKIALSTLLLFFAVSGFAQPRMSVVEAARQADSLLSKMTLDEKISMTRGYSRFFFNGIERLGIPYIYLSDASQGVNMRHNLPDPTMVRQLEKSTAFPCPIMLAATFNPALAYDYARSIGEECRAGGVEVLLGPGLNIYRNSQCGRNFEYFGEDPFLTSRITENYVQGMQSTGTAACLKHFLANNTEFYRRRSNSILDERTMREIYLPGFGAGIAAGVACVMTSYNRINGEWAGQSKEVITDLLRGELGFEGLVMTDWNSVYDMQKLILSGQNVEMPGSWKEDITAQELLSQGKITEADIDAMIRPLIATCIRFGLYDRKGDEKYKPELLAKLPEHEAAAYRTSSEGIVLLRNDGLLPLKPGTKILAAGQFLDEIPRGAGSAAVKGYNNVTLRQALEEQFGARVTFAEKPSKEQFAAADVVLVSVGTLDAESIERPFALPSSAEKLVQQAVGANPRTVVLVNSGSGIRMTGWADKAAAILYGWYPGQNGFRAIAKVLSGELNPSGKLPITIEKEFADSPAKGTIPPDGQFYNECRNERLIQLYDIPYTEGVLVGYRWYDTKGIEPLFPFGHGLSYTTFELSKPRLSAKAIADGEKVKISVRLTNTGTLPGAEVVQLYVSEKNPAVIRPVKELKGFRKTELAPGASQVVEFEIAYRDLAYWCDLTHAWRVNPGDFEMLLGTSSADIRHTLPLIAK
ncbi:MAG TPA: glycosyl hydrolase [Alistipes sp.]|uniref:beta-glucosidase n=1 Tax=Alistipes sp. TaxID=1872444 RepID=UPI000EC2E7D6|nr:glycoside hydrolase family 3 C-terminal domain-containing protein [Alistipes sp.]HAK85887.1 glycosyl hydrolase [Alistipes sp.]